jgi:allantoicase
LTDHAPLGRVNLAARQLGAGVVAASDESFAAKENLLSPGDPVFTPHLYGPVGKVMDGWETRRRRGAGHDWALVRLGAPGVIRRVCVDTTHFTGNYPERCSIDACAMAGYPGPAELLGAHADWVRVLEPTALRGDQPNDFDIDAERWWTHLRLNIYPDGGVARLRVYGDVVPDPRWLDGQFDLAAQENGGVVIARSDAFYSAPHQLNLPGRPATTAEGWETRRRRGAGRGKGSDWVVLRLAAAGEITQVEVDTTCFMHNAPAAVALTACDSPEAEPPASEGWGPLLPRTPLQPDTRHRFRIDRPAAATHVRVDIYPDGGLARLRLWGALVPAGRAMLERRWSELGGR